jgi:uncharacterized protein YjbI with pentapeptide repeats
MHRKGPCFLTLRFWCIILEFRANPVSGSRLLTNLLAQKVRIVLSVERSGGQVDRLGAIWRHSMNEETIPAAELRGTSEAPSHAAFGRRPGLGKLSPDLIDKARDDTAAQISRIGLTFVGTTLFCLLSLLSPDSGLLAGSEKLTVPLAGPVSFFGFVLLGPAMLIVLRVFLQVYVEHSNRLDRIAQRMPRGRVPTLVPLKNPLIRGVSSFVFYLLLPMTMLLFVWKAAVFPTWGAGLLCLAAGVMASHATLLVGISWRSRALLTMTVTLFAGGILAGDLGLGFVSLRRPFQLTSANLSGQSLYHKDLRGAYLAQANLTGAYLTGANLGHASLLQANLNGAELVGANLRDADLMYAHLRRAKLLGADLSSANLIETDLADAALHVVHLSRANLGGADLSHAYLFGAKLDSADLSGANLDGASLMNVDFSGANLSDSNLSGANLAYSKLTGANLTDSHLDRANLVAPTWMDKYSWTRHVAQT